MQPSLSLGVPSQFAVTLAEAKTHLHIDGADHDTYLNSLIAVAHNVVQAKLGRTLTTTNHTMTLDKFPRRTGAYRNDSSPYYQMPTAYWDFALPLTAVPIEIPYPPAVVVTRVAYHRDADGSLVEMVAGTDYTVDLAALPGCIRPPHAKSWPQDCRLYPGSVIVEWTAGYGGTSSVPPAIKHACLMLLTHYFDNRASVSDRTLTAVPESVDALLSTVSAGYYAQIR